MVVDKNQNEVTIGSWVKVLFIELGFISTLPKKEAKIINSMINKTFKVVEIEHGKAFVYQPFDIYNGFSLALASEDMELTNRLYGH